MYPTGWKVSDPDAMIFYDLKTYISNGSLEISVTNFDPRSENTFKRHHVISMYTNKWGEHHQIELLDTDWNFHTGTNYFGGVKLQSATYEDNKQVVLPANSLEWDKNQTYHLKFSWDEDTVRFYRNDTLLICTGHSHQFLLRYIFLGRDQTISGDYITDFIFQQYPAMIGPVFSNLIVKKIVSDTIQNPLVESFGVTNKYANAVRLGWALSSKGIARLIYKSLDTGKWDSTEVFGPPGDSFSYVIPNLVPGKEYEARVISYDELGNENVSQSLQFKTRDTDVYFLEPINDSFVEDAGIIGPYRNMANMGWLYLMTGRKRRTFLQFNTVLPNKIPRVARLRLHVRNGQGKVSNLCLSRVLEDWNENNITWQAQPQFGDICWEKIEKELFSPDSWISFNLPVDSIKGNGLNFAITTKDSGWISLDSKESLFNKPELILDYRRSYALRGKIVTFRNYPLDETFVSIENAENNGKMSRSDTTETDKNGKFLFPVKFDSLYHINFFKEKSPKGDGAISIYDAYLVARKAVGLDKVSNISKIVSDIDNDGQISIYDASLIAKRAIGLDSSGRIGYWYFDRKPTIANSKLDTVSILIHGFMVGDADYSWPQLSISPLCLRKRLFFRVKQGDGRIELKMPDLAVKKFGAIFINIEYNPHSIQFKSVVWPELMKKWTLVQNLGVGRIRLARFSIERTQINLQDLKVYFSILGKSKDFNLVIKQFQLDNEIFSNNLLTRVERQGKKIDGMSFSAYPNPFNTSTRFEWSLSNDSHAKLFIYNSLGELVFSKNINSLSKSGFFVWKGVNNQNISLGSGVYYSILKTDTGKFAQKILLLK